jgi:DNA topoisomerase-1
MSITIKTKEDIEKLTNLGDGPKEFPCPKCGKAMVIKLGRGGRFLSCGTYPECDGARKIDGAEIQPDAPLGVHPDTGENIYVLDGRFGPYIQQGETPATKDENGKTIPVAKRDPKPRRATLPKDVAIDDVTLAMAVRFLILPRELGAHPTTGEPVIASTGQYGPYIGHAGDFRSLKGADNPYDITYERALEILKEPKSMRKGESLAKELGINPKTKKLVNVYESKSGKYLRKGFKRINLPDNIDLKKFTLEDAMELLK